MVWTTLAITTMGASCIATGITSFNLRRSWDLQVSSVRWLFFVFFSCYFVFSFCRVLFMIVAVIKPLESSVRLSDEMLTDRYSRLGFFSVLHFKVSHDGLVTTLLVMGDSALFSIAIWTFPLAYELGEIAARSMDRGAEKEGEQIRWGYEITTAGDAFQLAFHTIREAAEYCLDVQMQLMEATWPRELHGLIPATKRQRARGRLIFCGLRVRMGIHDAVSADGPLVLDVHAVTGKMTYTGASEVIANEIGDLGDGGQILVTKRVADWLLMYQDLVAIPCSVDRVGEYIVPMINAPVEVFQVVPIGLSQRKKKFTTTLKKRSSATPMHPGVAGANTQQINTPPGLSSVAAQRRRQLYAQRERRRQLEQGALRRHASQRTLLHLDEGFSYSPTSSTL
ncbi:PH domain leucine-rich repeat-containing protein phosphatase 2 [Phytophthora boehmeriae]|uniref:PH domain leucine-rich repeat-containing protein phosphatase 2 n=1 Tax=Phytophthora boehmeriae TaxID=109152 RepID=A0A8T1WNU7_9STRA|nr:PH domain leucine-rich repeat-containing protein phosphatase 2 [Phytophthora boehmeriae]